MSHPNDAILLVDDEENVQSALRRLFHADGYRIETASTGEAGLAILDQQEIALIIADNAMPGMTGAEFLRRARAKQPETIRVMLTGYASAESAIDAINQGEVYRFATKPWDPLDLRLLVKQGLEQYRLVQENRRMHELIEEQNVLLRGWNQTLQKAVDERTEEIGKKNAELERLYTQLRGHYVDSVRVLVGLIEIRNPTISSHGRRVAALSKAIAVQLEIGEDALQTIEVAALLQDIGKIGLPDELLRKDERLLGPAERSLLRRHPVIGEAALAMVESLEPVALLVRHHHEHWDGKGYPDGLRGEGIPVGARIIAVADAFDHYRETKDLGAPDFVEAQLKLGTSGAFDPSVLRALAQAAAASLPQQSSVEIDVNVPELQPGMVLAEDLRTNTGILLIPKGETIKESYLEKLILHAHHKLIPSVVRVIRPLPTAVA